MKTRDATSGLGMGMTGVFLQAGGYFVQRSFEGMTTLGAILYLVGTGLSLAGLAYFAMSKGRSPAWALLAIISILGLVVLVALKDLSSDDEPAVGPQEEGEQLVARAAGLDYTGQWDEAIAIFEGVLQEPEYRDHHLYARNCIERIREKQRFAKEDVR